jgi:hypothetical protein
MTVQNYALNLGLNDVPDDSIDPEVWAEFQKVFQAIKNLADSMDSGANPAVAGSPGSQIRTQNYAVMWRVSSAFIPAGSVVQFAAGTAVAAGTADPYPDGFTESDVTAGVPAPFILFGAVWYPPGGLSIGSRYYVNNASPGNITTSSGAGRFIGQAIASNVIFFDPQRF